VCFDILYNFLSETFTILRRIERQIIINVIINVSRPASRKKLVTIVRL
jgi:hypothetical protein